MATVIVQANTKKLLKLSLSIKRQKATDANIAIFGLTRPGCDPGDHPCAISKQLRKMYDW